MNSRIHQTLKRKHISLLCAAVLVLLMPFTRTALPWVLVCWLAALIIEKAYLKNPFRFLPSQSARYAFYAFSGIYLLLLMSLIVSTEINDGIKQLTQSLSLLIIPIMVLYSSDVLRKNRTLILRSFIAGVSLAALLCFVFSLHTYINAGGSLELSEINAERFNEYFYYRNFSYYAHPAYFSLFLNISLVFLFFDSGLTNTKRRLISAKISLCLLHIAAIYFLSSRAGLITLFISLIFLAIFLIKSINKKRYKIFTFSVLLILIAMSVFNPRVYPKLQQAHQYFFQANNNKQEATPSRIAIWKSAWLAAEKNLLTGNGIGTEKYLIGHNYKPEKYLSVNAHNQFLDYTVSAGIFTGLLLTLQMIFGLITAVRKEQLAFVLFIIYMGINLLFESMLYRLLGVVFYSFFFSFFLIMPHSKKRQIKQTPDGN
jgi:O-antigen ligase